MDCERAIELISSQLDHELPAEDSRMLDAHLLGCAACQAAVEVFREQDEDLRQAYAGCGPAADQVAKRVISQLHQETVPSSDFRERSWKRRILAFPWREYAGRISAISAMLFAMVYCIYTLWQKPVQPRDPFAKVDVPVAEETGTRD